MLKFDPRAFLQEYLPEMMLWVTVGVVLLAVGVFIIRRFPKGAEGDKPPTSDMMDAMRDLHVRGQLSDDEYHLAAGRLVGQRIYLDYPSHTGTENVLLAATLASGTTVLKHASAEPETASPETTSSGMAAVAPRRSPASHLAHISSRSGPRPSHRWWAA